MRAPLRWLLPLGLVAGLACCAQSDSGQGLQAGALTTKARIYLIKLKDGAAAGLAVGCGDSAVPVEVDLPRPAAALEGSLQALLSAGERYASSGLYNALTHSPLKVQRIERAGSEVTVFLSGYIEIGGECDGPRVLTQLTETALQFQDVQRARFFLDGKPLQVLLSGKS